MTGKKPSIYWLICWRYVSPIAMVVILIASFIQMGVSGAGKNQNTITMKGHSNNT
jgi:solute carrier family 6 amino acid/orphan transporter-like 15/16/17/18/20